MGKGKGGNAYQGNANDKRLLMLINVEVVTEKYTKDSPQGRTDASELQH